MPVCAAGGIVGGLMPAAAAAAAVLCAIPALFGLLGPDAPRIAVPMQVLGWTLLATVALAVTGGPASPLTVLYVLGPLSGLALGRRAMALEAAGFSVVAFAGLSMVDLLVELPMSSADWSAFVLLLTLSGIVQAGVLCAAALVRHAAERPDRPVGRRDAAVTLDLNRAIHLPSDAPVLLISVTPQGRIRALEGRRAWLASARVGSVCEPILQAAGRWDPPDLPATGGKGWLTLAGEARPLRASVQATPDGWLIALAEMPAQPSGDTARERTAFFASLGHELKTPLNAIIGFADMMKAGVRGPLPEAYAEYAGIIHESGQDLLLLVEDMLDLAKADARRLRLEIEPVELAESGRSVARQLGAQAERADVKLSLDLDTEVWARADARAVRQIWQNLVSNAIKYSEPGGTVRLVTRHRPGQGVLAVEDQGEGMDEADLARLAEPFAQGSNAAGRAGTGLGLAVVKQFADAMGGKVAISTARGAGTEVKVYLPEAAPDGLEQFARAAQ